MSLLRKRREKCAEAGRLSQHAGRVRYPEEGASGARRSAFFAKDRGFAGSGRKDAEPLGGTAQQTQKIFPSNSGGERVLFSSAMLRVQPFQGLRPADDLAHLVACVPYDVVDAREAAALTQDNPYSLMHVDRAEIDLPPDTDPYSPAVYQQARESFLAFQRLEVLVREPEPCVYLYRQRMGDRTQTGIARPRGPAPRAR